MTYEFRPRFACVAGFRPNYSIHEMSREVGVFSATPEFVRWHCGPIACSILDCVPDAYYREADRLGLHPNVDIRIHRLYPGDFPAYPGWHCDGEFRETFFAQPDLTKVQVHQHLTATASTHIDGVSNTQFLNEELTCELEPATQDITLWGQVHRIVEARQSKHLFDSRDGQLMQFDSWTLHRAMATKIRGWRLFFRMAMWHKPNLGDGGMVTKQEQVYKLVEGGGW